MEGFLHLTGISNKQCLQLVKLMQTLAKCKPGFGNKAMCGCVNSTSVIVHKGLWKRIIANSIRNLLLACFVVFHDRSSCHPMLILDQGIVLTA